MSAIRINTERLHLRALEPDDAPVVYAYRSLSEVSRFQLWEPASVAEVRALIARQARILPNTAGTWYQLAICLNHTVDLIGDCGLHFPQDNTRDTEIGITVAPDHQGNGYAQEALNAVFAFLFEVLAKTSIYALVDPRNQVSVRMLEAVGMIKEAVAGDVPWYNGDNKNDILYSLPAKTWHTMAAGSISGL